MKRVLRWSGMVLIGLAGVLVLAGAVVYALSARRLQRVHVVTIVAPGAIPTDPGGLRTRTAHRDRDGELRVVPRR